MKTQINFKSVLVLLLSLSFTATVSSQNIEADIDSAISEIYTPEGTGVTVLIAKDGKPIYRKAFGKANLELDVTMKPENVFEIGSITKQFTAVTILMLEEQGKLKVEDDITKYITDYPTHGKTITIHHLLNHTSGIKSYTSMDSFQKHARTDMTPTELIDVFKNEPMDFDPGEKFLYNNSGYILLGHIIEVISGQSYEDFIEKNIFEKLGMTSSYYGSMKQLIKNRASGYNDTADGYVNADYLSLTLPYAAGSIMSTIDDLLTWQNAISANALITRKSLEKAINGSTLNSGEKIEYGYGWGSGKLQESRSISHGGGIFGYTTMGLFLPEENMYVIALSNCNCKNVGAVAEKAAAITIGKPFPDKKDAIVLSEDELQKWVGAYEFDGEVVRHITLKDGQLFSQREGSTVLEIYPMTETNFIFDGGNTIYDFSEKDGKKQAAFTSRGNTVLGKEVDKTPPAEKVAIALSAEALKSFEGTYELAPTFKIVVTAKDSQLFAQATGQPQFELFAEDEDTFFLKVVPASIDFEKDDAGKVVGLIMHQGGQDMPGKKVE